MSQGVHSLVVWARFQSLEAKMRMAAELGDYSTKLGDYSAHLGGYSTNLGDH
jgi:hypothetical protein